MGGTWDRAQEVSSSHSLHLGCSISETLPRVCVCSFTQEQVQAWLLRLHGTHHGAPVPPPRHQQAPKSLVKRMSVANFLKCFCGREGIQSPAWAEAQWAGAGRRGEQGWSCPLLGRPSWPDGGPHWDGPMYNPQTLTHGCIREQPKVLLAGSSYSAGRLTYKQSLRGQSGLLV